MALSGRIALALAAACALDYHARPWRPADAADADSLAAGSSASNAATRVIPFRVTAKFFNPLTQKVEPTAEPIVDKIKRAFALWSSVSAAGLRFVYDGLARAHYTTPSDIPDDGRITVVLDGDHRFGGPLEAGHGGYQGTIPGNYRKGYVFLNTRAGRASLRMATLLHEIGHALGLRHVPSIAAIMSCGSKVYNGEYLFFSQQDRASLIHVWNRESSFSLSGVVHNVKRSAFVHAVEVRSGRTFSTVSGMTGRFTIAVGEPGRYRLFAKGFDSLQDKRPVFAPSWYLGPSEATADPYAGKVFDLSPQRRHVDGLQLATLKQPAPLKLYWSRTYTGRDQPKGAYVHAFLRPGHAVRFNLTHTAGQPTALVPYGTNPDIALDDIRFIATNGTTMVTVRASLGAKPGHRLLLARGNGGGTVAGLVGIHLIDQALPSRLPALADQLAGRVDMKTLDVNFWH